MIKKICSTITLLLFTCLLFSQDTIYKRDGSIVIAKIIEINSSAIKYKIGVGSNETIIEIKKASVASISYSNGLKETYNSGLEITIPNNAVARKEVPAANEEIMDEVPTPFLKNIIAINVFEMAFVNFSCSYERILKSGKIGLKLPVSFGLGGRPSAREPGYNESVIYLYNKIFGTGLELNYYPLRQTRHTFFVGVSGLVGSFNYYQYVPDYYSPSGPYIHYPPTQIKHIGIQYAGMLHMGTIIGLSKNILIGGKLGIGYKQEETVYVDYTQPKLQLDLNLAYKF